MREKREMREVREHSPQRSLRFFALSDFVMTFQVVFLISLRVVFSEYSVMVYLRYISDLCFRNFPLNYFTDMIILVTVL